MSRLLGVGIRRYTRSVIFWLGILATVISAIFNGLDSKNYYLDDSYTVLQYLINTVVVTWMIGREGSEGIFRNKIVVGHTKMSIYLSEYILATVATSIMFLIHAVIFGICNSYANIAMDMNMMVKLFIIFALVNMSLCSIIVFCSCMISRAVIAAVFNIFLVIGMYYCAYCLESVMYEEQYTYEADYKIEVFEDEDGIERTILHEIEGTGRYVENPYYTGGALRIIYEIAYDIVPLCQMNEYIDVMENYGIMGYIEDVAYGEPEKYENRFEQSQSLTAKEDKVANIDIICSILVIVVTTTGGMLIFRKKRFK